MLPAAISSALEARPRAAEWHPPAGRSAASGGRFGGRAWDGAGRRARERPERTLTPDETNKLATLGDSTLIEAIDNLMTYLADVKDDIGITRHMTHGPGEPTVNEWHRAVDHLDLAAQTASDQCESTWALAKGLRNAHELVVRGLKAEHAAEVERVRGEKAAPGSIEDQGKLKAAWWILGGAARVALAECKKAGRDPRTGHPLPKPARKPKPKATGRRKRPDDPPGQRQWGRSGGAALFVLVPRRSLHSCYVAGTVQPVKAIPSRK